MPTNVVGGFDGVTFPPGLTNQSTIASMNIGAALESGGGGGSLGPSTPAANNYLAWSIIPEDAIALNGHTSTNGFLTRIVAGGSGSCAHLDIVVTSSGSVTNAVFGLYTGAGFAVGPAAWTANVSATITGAAGLYALTWNGASSPASVQIISGTTYWIYSEVTGTTPTLAGSAGASAFSMNPNLTASAIFANNSMTLSAAAPTSLTATTTLAPQTSWANTGTKMWFGLRA